MIKGLLIDLDGVIYNDSRMIDGAAETIGWLRERRIPFCFITNTTMKSRSALQSKLGAFGIRVREDEIFSAVTAAARFIAATGKKANCYFLLSEEAVKEFPCRLNSETGKVDFVVVGDLGEEFTYKKLNEALRHLLDGAQLLALQKNRFWLSDEGYKLDAGAFVAMLEFAANARALVVGKPSAAFFKSALHSLQLPPEQVLMIGDDMESDIKGAAALGIQTCLLQTGKYRKGDERRFDIKPDVMIPGIWNLPDLTLFSEK